MLFLQQRPSVKVYTNIKSKKTIIEYNNNKSRIYKWINNQAGKFYIGSSVYLSKRLLYYLNTKYITKYKGKSIIYSALLKYGYINFTF